MSYGFEDNKAKSNIDTIVSEYSYVILEGSIEIEITSSGLTSYRCDPVQGINNPKAVLLNVCLRATTGNADLKFFDAYLHFNNSNTKSCSPSEVDGVPNVTPSTILSDSFYFPCHVYGEDGGVFEWLEIQIAGSITTPLRGYLDWRAVITLED